ncbi:MAG: class I SAM-dependent methyltransferase [Rhizobiaceae bacterium]|nr:class I SAM-dependent methyltransferase [Rhizobiaceae bacterium]
MSEENKVFTGSIPENYDRYMVPLIFGTYAADLALRAASFSPRSVLEVAAGTGAVTRELAPRLSSDANYVVTDLSQAMLDYAMSRQPTDGRIQWMQADAMALPCRDAAFDLVCCQFGVMFFPDRTAGYREAKRVLKPGGRFLFNVWDRVEENVFANDVLDALSQIFPDNPPRFITQIPHGYFDTALIQRELESAGFSSVAIEKKTEESRAPSPLIAALAYSQGTPLRNEIEARGANLADVTDRISAHLAQKHGNAQISAKIQAFVVSAVA